MITIQSVLTFFIYLLFRPCLLRQKYKFNKDNLKLICDDLKFVNWFNIFDTDDLEKVCKFY